MTLKMGGCLCGDVRYGVSDEPKRIMICHCKFCQRATGSAFMVDAVFAEDDFELKSGAPKVFSHRSEGSKKMVNIHFCATCGTKLYLTFERLAGIVGVYAGTFDDPKWIPRTGEKVHCVFTESGHGDSLVAPDIKLYQAALNAVDGESVSPFKVSTPTTIRELPQPE